MSEKKSMTFNLFEDFDDNLNKNIFAATVAESVKNVSAKKNNRIEDFGEKLDGARKDAHITAAESEIKSHPFSKSFPKPNYQKLLDSGEEQWKVSAIRTLRDFLSPKPKGIYSWALDDWTKKATELRDIAVAVMNDELSESGFRDKLSTLARINFPFNRNDEWQIQNICYAYEKLVHEYDFSELKFVNYTDNKIGLRSKKFTMKNQVDLRADTPEELLLQYSIFKELTSDKKIEREKKNPFGIYRWKKDDSYYFIGAKIGAKMCEVKSPFETTEEAFKFLNENFDLLKKIFSEMKKVPYERENENTPRTGEIIRQENITPEKFQETFGFRGVQFGNWIKNETRQEDLNKAYDALTDLANALNLPPKSLSLNGTLGLAFGSRGKGGKNAPLAHYEPSNVVINLTKNKGAGSLGHEFFHALDNYFSKKIYATNNRMLTEQIQNNEIFEEEDAALVGFQMLKKTLSNTELVKRSENLDKMKGKKYWSTESEMSARAFEFYLKEKLVERGIKNDFLVNIRSEESWDEVAEKSAAKNCYPYQTKSETEDIKAAFDFLFDSIRFHYHDKNYEIYSAATENIAEKFAESNLIEEEKLTEEQKFLQTFSREIFDSEVKFFAGSEEIHGRYDYDTDIFYLNANAEISLDWIFYHETFHALKISEPELYEDLREHVERENIFTPVQIKNYRQAIKQPSLSDSKVVEEMLADAFADLKTGRKILQDMADKKPTLANKIITFAKKILDCAKKFLHDEKKNYPCVSLSDSQFKSFAERIEKNINSVKVEKNLELSKGYRILMVDFHSPFTYLPELQKKFDLSATKKLLQKYPPSVVGKTIFSESPMAKKIKNYASNVIHTVASYSR